MIFENSIKRGR